MAKMFYSLTEAANRLGKSEDELRKMAESGQLQEFRDGDSLMFKRDQIDLLTDDDDGDLDGGDDDILGLADSGELSLADSVGAEASASGMDLSPMGSGDTGLGASGSMIGLADSTAGGDSAMGASSTGLGMADSAELDLGGSASGLGMADSAAGSGGLGADTGISIFEADETEEVDPAAQTNIDDAVATPDFAMDSGSSGSGLLDLTRESDDTSLGADLLDDVYGGDTADETADETMPAADASALFESTDESETETEAAPMAMAIETVDGAGSGLVGGMALGMALVLSLATAIVVLGWVGSSGSTIPGTESMISQVGEQWMMIAGGALGAVIVFGVIGMVLGKRGD